MKTFKTKIYLNNNAKEYCQRAFGVRRRIWNWAVAYSIECRKLNHERPNNYRLDKECRKRIAAQSDANFRWIAEHQVSGALI